MKKKRMSILFLSGVLLLWGCGPKGNLQGVQVKPDPLWKPGSSEISRGGFQYAKDMPGGPVRVTGALALVDSRVYKGDSQDFRKYRDAAHGTFREAVIGKLGGYRAMKVRYEGGGGEDSYLYLIDVAGDIDVILTIVGQTGDLVAATAEWQEYIKAMELAYK